MACNNQGISNLTYVFTIYVTYTLSEALTSLAHATIGGGVGGPIGMTFQVQVDEESLVLPLGRILSEHGIRVRYYAPPSAEETRYAQQRGSII